MPSRSFPRTPLRIIEAAVRLKSGLNLFPPEGCGAQTFSLQIHRLSDGTNQVTDSPVFG